MTRSRTIGLLLGLILLACVAVIVMDQMGLFGSAEQPVQITIPNTDVQPTPEPLPGESTTGDGYDELK